MLIPVWLFVVLAVWVGLGTGVNALDPSGRLARICLWWGLATFAATWVLFFALGPTLRKLLRLGPTGARWLDPEDEQAGKLGGCLILLELILAAAGLGGIALQR